MRPLHAIICRVLRPSSIAQRSIPHGFHTGSRVSELRRCLGCTYPAAQLQEIESSPVLVVEASGIPRCLSGSFADCGLVFSLLLHFALLYCNHFQAATPSCHFEHAVNARLFTLVILSLVYILPVFPSSPCCSSVVDNIPASHGL